MSPVNGLAASVAVTMSNSDITTTAQRMPVNGRALVAGAAISEIDCMSTTNPHRVQTPSRYRTGAPQSTWTA